MPTSFSMGQLASRDMRHRAVAEPPGQSLGIAGVIARFLSPRAAWPGFLAKAPTGAATSYRVVRPPERQDRSGHGLLREFGISRSLAGSKHLSMAYGTVPAGESSSRHYHPFETAVFIVSGRARAFFGRYDEEWADLEAGDFLYIPAGLPHSTVSTGDVPVRYVLARAAPEDVVITVG